MTIDAIAPVLARIAELESGFAQRWPSAVSAPVSTEFADVLTAATSTPATRTQAAAPATTAVSATPTASSPAASVAPFVSHFLESGTRHGVPPQLLAAVAYVESRYQPNAVSPSGAVGLMQLMPVVSESLGVDPRDPKSAIDGAARLLADHEQRFGSWDLALAAYFSGAQAVEDAGRVPPTERSVTYVNDVNERMGMS